MVNVPERPFHSLSPALADASQMLGCGGEVALMRTNARTPAGSLDYGQKGKHLLLRMLTTAES